MTEFIIIALILGILALVFIVLGYLIWKKEKISLLHDYHYNRVSPENKKAFCTMSGLGVILIGLGILITAIIIAATDSAWSFLAFAIGFLIGLALLIFAGMKYNR